MIHPDYEKAMFPHWSTMPIRFRDLDPLNHVNNAIFSTFFEEARINFVHQIPEFTEELEKGFSFVLVNISIDFIRPVKYPAKLLIGTGVKTVGNTSVTSFQTIYDSGNKDLISAAESTGVWFDLDNNRPTQIPDIKEQEKYLLSKNLFK